jgi:cellulose synthase/poly-beta-1,6-N-acetylglucosamine synthase-like glycosyltransferase
MEPVSIYIPCFNDAQHLPRCLEGIRQLRNSPSEIIVVDDGSDDETTGIARDFGVRVIRHSVKQGLAAARNTALHHAHFPLIASLDSISVPHPIWLRELLKELHDDTVAGAGGMIQETEPEGLIKKGRGTCMGKPYEELMRSLDPPVICSSNSLFRRQALLQIGGYDERLERHFEDADISVRLKAVGYTIVYTPSAVVSQFLAGRLSAECEPRKASAGGIS